MADNDTPKPSNALIANAATNQQLSGVLTGAGVINNIQLTAEALPSVVISQVETSLAAKQRANAEAREAANGRMTEIVDAFNKRFTEWAEEMEAQCDAALDLVLPEVAGDAAVATTTSHHLDTGSDMLIVTISKRLDPPSKVDERLSREKTPRLSNLLFSVNQHVRLPSWVTEHRDAVKAINKELNALSKELVRIKQCEARLPAMARLAQGNTVAHVLSSTSEGDELLTKLRESAAAVLRDAGLE